MGFQCCGKFCSTQHRAERHLGLSAFQVCSQRCGELVGCPTQSTARRQFTPPAAAGICKPGGTVLQLAPQINRAARKRSAAKTQIHPFIHPCVFRGKGEQRQVRACQGHTRAVWFPRPVAPSVPCDSPTRKATGFHCYLGPQQHLGLSQLEQIIDS